MFTRRRSAAESVMGSLSEECIGGAGLSSATLCACLYNGVSSCPVRDVISTWSIL